MTNVIVVTRKPEKNEKLQRLIIPLETVKFISEESDGTVFIAHKKTNLFRKILGQVGGVYIMENFESIVRQINGSST